MKHTPGPWEELENEGCFIDVLGPNSVTVCTVSRDNGSLSTRDARANARLIAAAPELLEALRKMMEAISLFESNRLIKANVPLGLAMMDAKQSARNAIRKAKEEG